MNAWKEEGEMIDNPFTYGNPISNPSRFSGRQYEVGQIFSRLRNAEFESSALSGERRMGKTSLLNYLANPTVRHFYGLDPDRYMFVYVDLQMMDRETTPTRLWQHLLQQMAQCCYDTEVKQALEEMHLTASSDAFALTDLFHRLDTKNLYVVLLLDEFENVTENPHFDLSFFYNLRSLAIHHHLALITSSKRELIELCHSEAIRSSPFFNIFANFNLHLFNDAEALEVISRFLQGSTIRFTSAELDTIFSIAGHHPYFLQIACYFLFEAHFRRMPEEERLQFLYSKYVEQATPHFEDYWQHSPDQEKIVLTALALLRNQQRKIGAHTFSLKQLQDLYTRSEQILGHLRKRGLLVSQGETYAIFNTVFSDWICREITNTLNDSQSYKDWLKSNKSAMRHFSGRTKRDLSTILPRIGSTYRELIINWASDPKNLVMVATLLKTALSAH
jgi:eukaryotic-like serine/threonine-protein kinase